ncbi:MAG: glycosyltransferase family 9 protein [Acidaminococcaceae bacterium]|nr:glycosyltransferase family 9 protein [Acidaminococcaceae bacterium]MDD4722448.1 glycosyltransferase family 9 protein [Acidaminococcaceae bacterium]
MNIKKRLKALNWQRIETIRAIKLFILKKYYKSRKVPVIKDELKKCKKILIFMSNSGFGDAIVVTGLIKALKDKGFEVTILVEKRLFMLFKEAKLVDGIFLIENKKALSATRLEKAIRNGPYDLLIDFCQEFYLADNLLSLNLYKIFKPRYLAGFNDVFEIFDIPIKYEGKNEHFSKRLDAFLNAIGICDYKMKYTIDIPLKYAEETEAFLEQFRGEKIVCLNPFASRKHRDFSLEQIVAIANHLNNKENVRMIIVGEPYQLHCLKTINLPECVVINKLNNFFNAAYIVKKADLVISTDTSIVHLANAYDKKLICLYNNRILDSGHYNNSVWAPNYDKAIQLFTKEKQGTFEGDLVSNFDVAEINYYVDTIL